MNLATEVMKGVRGRLGDFEKQVQKYAEEPYGTRKMTAQEEMDKYNNLTEAQLYEMIDKHGGDDVNKWMFRMEKKMEQRSK